MNTQSMVSNIIILLLPVMLMLDLWLFHWIGNRLPEKQRAALDHFVDIAVKNVEQQYTDNPDKKNLAIKIVKQSFQALKLPVPDAALIDAAIEACVYELRQQNLSHLEVQHDRAY